VSSFASIADGDGVASPASPAPKTKPLPRKPRGAGGGGGIGGGGGGSAASDMLAKMNTSVLPMEEDGWYGKQPSAPFYCGAARFLSGEKLKVAGGRKGRTGRKLKGGGRAGMRGGKVHPGGRGGGGGSGGGGGGGDGDGGGGDKDDGDEDGGGGGGEDGRGLHSSTFRHNVSAFCGTGGYLGSIRGCLGGDGGY